MLLNPILIAPFFDWLKFNRAGYLWSASFNFLAALVSVKVFWNWKKKQEAIPHGDNLPPQMMPTTNQ